MKKIGRKAEVWMAKNGDLHYVSANTYGRNVLFAGDGEEARQSELPAHIIMQIAADGVTITKIDHLGRNCHPRELKNAIDAFAQHGWCTLDNERIAEAFQAAEPVNVLADRFRTRSKTNYIGTNDYNSGIVTGYIRCPYNVSDFLGLLKAMLDRITAYEEDEENGDWWGLGCKTWRFLYPNVSSSKQERFATVFAYAMTGEWRYSFDPKEEDSALQALNHRFYKDPMEATNLLKEFYRP